MPRIGTSVPRYRKHKASGQAVVTLSGQDFYLGPHGTQVSLKEYDRQISEWLARDRRPSSPAVEEGYTVVELIADYKRHATKYYRKNGRVTNEVTAILSAAAFVRQAYGREPANDFGPLKLQAIQQAMIRADWSRKHINKQISRIVRMFAWGVSQEKVAVTVADALRKVKGLRKDRTDARAGGVGGDILRLTLSRRRRLHSPPAAATLASMSDHDRNREGGGLAVAI
jgi:hypothetical protein